MNINFGLLEKLPEKKYKKKDKNILYVNNSLQALNEWIRTQKLD